MIIALAYMIYWSERLTYMYVSFGRQKLGFHVHVDSLLPERVQTGFSRTTPPDST